MLPVCFHICYPCIFNRLSGPVAYQSTHHSRLLHLHKSPSPIGMVQTWISRNQINGVVFFSSHVLLSALISTSQAQHPNHSSLLVPTERITTETTTTTSPVTIYTSYTLTIDAPSPSNSTSTSTTSRRTADIHPPLYQPPSTGAQHDPNKERNEKAFNYYFLILGGIVLAIALFLWWVRRRKRLQKEQMRLSGQNALARDLDGWANSRRWLHGTWRQNQNATLTRHDEGLNEQGEAPPPYQSKNEVSSETRDPSTSLAVPMHALSRDELYSFRPPAYQVSSGGDPYTNSQPDTLRTIPERRDIRTASSTRIE